MGSDRGADPGVHGLQASLLVELQAAVTALRWTDAGTAMDAFLTAHEAVHDGYRDVIARILSSILSTFGMADFTVYCNHCSEMSRTILKGGGHGWLIEGWTPDHRFGGCRLHVFKSFAHVNGEFFRRLELTPPSEAPGETGERWFSPDELTELSTPISARVRRALDRHDAAQASALIAA